MHDPISSLRQLLSQSPSMPLWEQLVHQIAAIPEAQTPSWLSSWLLEHLSSWAPELRDLTSSLLAEISPEPKVCLQKLQPLLPSVAELDLEAAPSWHFCFALDCWDSLQHLEWHMDPTPELAMTALARAPFLGRLRFLGWESNQTTVDNIELFLPVLHAMNSLQKLDLRNNELEDAGVEVLIKHTRLPSLKFLYLNYNELTNDFYDFTVEPLFATPRWRGIEVELEEMMYAGMGRSGPLRKVLNKADSSFS